ncbi:PA3371 family protein [Pseudomonas sp. NA-150]|uniref:PA3371 family protein n=1 Tax=Pseudomonas sp. NA-150 TaxID=3367525 RepID=UPI0037CC8B57
MSKSALSFLVMALMALAIDISLPLDENTASALLKIAAGVFVVLFVLALVIGRKIKFDPVLR